MLRIFVLTLLVLVTPPTDALACTLAALPRIFKTNVSYFTAKPTENTVRANSLNLITYSRDRKEADTSYASGEFQIFEADKLYGDRKEIKILESAFKKQKNRNIIGVFWGVTASCHPMVEIDQKTTKQVVFTTRIRPKDKWINGIPTFDFHINKGDMYDPTKRYDREDFKSVEDFIEKYKGL